jgi:hypothetical protein
MDWRVLLVAACAAAFLAAPGCDGGDGDADADADADGDGDADADADGDADGDADADADGPPPCEDGDGCDDPGAATCADETRVRVYEATGRCVGGRCYYEPIDVACELPPFPTCEGNALLTWEGAGTCDAGQCSYDSVETDCGAAGCCEDQCCGG